MRTASVRMPSWSKRDTSKRNSPLSLRTVFMKVCFCSGVLSTGGNWVNMFVRRSAAGTSDNLAGVVAAVNVRRPPGFKRKHLSDRAAP